VRRRRYEIVVGVKLPRERNLAISLAKRLGSDRIYFSNNGSMIIEVDEEILRNYSRLISKILKNLEKISIEF